MNQDLFTNLPSTITINILSRLPVRTIVRCKCVCKPWLDLLETHDFAKHHLSKSSPGLAVYQSYRLSDLYEIYEFKDGPDLDHHEIRYNLVKNFKLPYHGVLQGSANGFLFLRDLKLSPNGLFICNPITREHIEIQSPQDFDYAYPQNVTFGFGASRATGQYKVVRVSHDCALDKETNKWLATKPDCHVYTLGTGSWRRVAPANAPLMYSCRSTGASLNGNLHWLVFDVNGEAWSISCFDLETELFSIISPPPPLRTQGRLLADVFALGDRLRVCDNSSEEEIVVWLMEEYGDEEYWRKEIVAKKPDVETSSWDPYEVVRPIKVFKDGDVLMAWGDFFLLYYSSKTGAVSEIQKFGLRSWGAIEAILHTSSFLSLKSFGMEKVGYF